MIAGGDFRILRGTIQPSDNGGFAVMHFKVPPGCVVVQMGVDEWIIKVPRYRVKAGRREIGPVKISGGMLMVWSDQFSGYVDAEFA